jgi:predicted permease
MSTLRSLLHRLRAIVLRNRVEAELDDELRDHEQREIARQIREGVPAADAHRHAALRMGSLVTAREGVRDERGGRLLADLLTDLRIGWRGLRRNTGLTAAIVLSLGLGVGGTTAVFSVVEAVLLRPLPYPNGDRLHLVRVWWNDFSAALSPADFFALRDHAQRVAPVGAFTLPNDGFALVTNSGPEIFPGAIVSDELPAVLGVAPIVGSGFSSDRTAAEALISRSFWETRFGTRADIVGQSLVLDGVSHTIVGVMPDGFNVPGERNGVLWTRLRLREPTRRGPFYLRVIARIDDAGSSATESRLTDVVRAVLRERYGVKPDWRYGMVSVKETLVGEIRTTLLLALTAVGLVLLIAVLNVANLLLARAIAREREMAVRASLGAGRGRLVRQMLAEASLVGLMGGSLGLGLALVALWASHETALAFVPRMEGASLNPFVILFALGAGVGAAMLSALLPVLRLPWGRLADSLRSSGRSSGEGPREGRVRRALVTAEIALSLTMLVGAALLMKSLAQLESADPGFEPKRVVSFMLSLPFEQYNVERTQAFLAALDLKLRALPQVSSVSMASSLPPNRLTMSNNYTLEGARPADGGSTGVAEWITVSPEYFRTLGIGLTRGRVFADTDTGASPGVAIVNESFARRRFSGQDAVGKRLKNGDWKSTAPWTTIVGVVKDVPYDRGVWGGAAEGVYVALGQVPRMGSPFVSLQTSGDPAQLVSSVRESVRQLDASLPLRDVATMETRLRQSTLAPRFRGLLALALACIGLALAVTGIYGVMAYHVDQRRRETAIRRALGAGGGQVAGAVVGSGLRLAAAGVLIGCVGSFALTRSLSTLLYQVTPHDPAVVAIAAAILAATAAAACTIPALRAARVDPVTILRDE